MGDAPAPLHLGGLHNNQAGAGKREQAELAICQSVADPSRALYWHIGETAKRLASPTGPSLIGKRRDWALGWDLRTGTRVREMISIDVATARCSKR